MKNLVIFGASRAGKTTLAREISKIYPHYHIIHGDAVRGAFSSALPQNDINSHKGKGMKDDFPRFLAELLREENDQDKDIFNHIIETCDVSVENALKYFKKEHTVIVYLGFAELSINEAFKNYRKYEKQTDWTYERSDEHMLKHAKEWIAKSKIFKEDCEKHNIRYVDTSYNREEVLKKLIKDLKEELK